jgi:tripartite-type tricarboxylate transporter receptor subunit TctC
MKLHESAGPRQFSIARMINAVVITAFATLTSSQNAVAQTYPSKPIRFVVPYPAGGPLDQVARLLAEKLRDALGQPVLVDNKPGAGGNIGADLVAKAPPDGYTMLMGAVATHAINPYLYSKMPYDANKDFTPVTRVAIVPNVLVMNIDAADKLNLKSVADLIQYAKRNPGKLNYASGGNGSAGHLAGELFKTQAGISMVHIAYSGAPPAQLGLLAGQTDLMFDNLASAAPQIKAGKLKAFAVTTSVKSSFFPEIPALASLGVPGFDISTWFGIFLPANAQKSVVDKLHAEVTKALALPDVKDRLARLAADASPMTPEAFTGFVLSEQAKYMKLIPATGARID